MQATALDRTQKRRGIEDRKILERITSSLPVPPRFAASLYTSYPSPSDSRFLFFSGLTARNQSALLYIGRSVGRSRGLLPLSGEVCQEFIESIGDIGQLIPVARLGISWTTTNAHIRLPTTNISHNYREMRFIGADLLIWRTFTRSRTRRTSPSNPICWRRLCRA